MVSLGIREDRPALEVVNAHASHDAPQGSRFKRRGNGVYQGSVFAIACFSEHLRGRARLGHPRPCLVSAVCDPCW